MLVRRARAVRVSGSDEHGAPRKVEAQGWHARILQHEVDHLNGILCLDWAHPRSFMAHNAYVRRWKTAPVEEIQRELAAFWGRDAGTLDEEHQTNTVSVARDFVAFLRGRLTAENHVVLDAALADFQKATHS